ncbi:hypothetical protein LJC07_04015 [Christensenellaceae bacterium OttesenSCG-928-L17]|nr:hypothetical protein [Christensenellaceae bacterium OttesenSCG-928-L17]
MNCTVLLKNETHEEERINRARERHKLTEYDLILVADDEGFIDGLCRLSQVNNALGEEYADIYEAATEYQNYLNGLRVNALEDAEAALALMGIEKEEVDG